jgi:hypothetical protein
MLEQQHFNNESFVDDNGITAFWRNIITALQQSLLATFLLFGWPDNDRWGSCIAPAKLDPVVTYIFLFLGYHTNSRTMMVTWPCYKQEALHAGILDALLSKQ